MQLKDVYMKKDEVHLTVTASLIQWVELFGLTLEEFQERFSGSIFQLIKEMNGFVNKKEAPVDVNPVNHNV